MGKIKTKTFPTFFLITTIVQETALVVILLVIMPQFRVHVPFWLVTLVIIVWAAGSYIMYKVGTISTGKIPVMGNEALVGIKCRTTTPLSPVGYVKVGNELWQAQSIDGQINSDVELVIIGVKKLTLLVTLPADTNCGNGHNLSSKSPGN